MKIMLSHRCVTLKQSGKILFGTVVFLLCASAQTPSNDDCAKDNENLVCCFVNTPSVLNHIISIADRNEPGERMHIKGTVLRSDGKAPYANVILYAYQTNEKGIYPKRGNEVGIHKWHGYLHSWGRTNEKGEFEILSIRPARYPTNSTPAHIHIVVKEPNGKIYYVNDIMFADDRLVRNKKEDGVIVVKKNAIGVWEGKRIIVLQNK